MRLRVVTAGTPRSCAGEQEGKRYLERNTRTRSINSSGLKLVSPETKHELFEASEVKRNDQKLRLRVVW